MKKIVLLSVVIIAFSNAQSKVQKSIYIDPLSSSGENNIFFPHENKLLLKKVAQRLGYEVIDSHMPQKDHSNIHALIFFNMPDSATCCILQKKIDFKKLVVCLWEPPAVMMHNYQERLHAVFSKIITWDDSLVDGKKYHKLVYSFSRGLTKEALPFSKKKLCCLMCGNKKSSHPNELYSKRKNIINFFKRHYQKDLDLYGAGWEINKPVYKGYSKDKLADLHRYKFNICYENCKNTQGYITEKILHCLLVKCVPVYWGATNIQKYIPKECYIDRTAFKRTEDLYAFLKNMPEEKYQTYIDAMEKYLESAQSWLFSPLYYVENLLKAVIPEYDRTKAFTKEQVTLLNQIDLVKQQYQLP